MFADIHLGYRNSDNKTFAIKVIEKAKIDVMDEVERVALETADKLTESR